ncbi:MAG: hypothetical protein MGG11_03930 [Trichodesmium sp. MAG_R03]|nr:hypothetical protein [Trichodesmium sp. MAG_R03]
MLNSVSFSPDGGKLVSGSKSKTIKLYSKKSNSWQAIWTDDSYTGTVNDLQFNKDSRKMVSASNDGTIKIWDLNKKNF